MSDETGGDEARVREIADVLFRKLWPAYPFDRHSGEWIQSSEAIRAGFAAGRAAENEACERLASEGANESEQKLGYYGEAPAALDALADAIAARRGRVGK